MGCGHKAYTKEILELCYPVYIRRENDKILDAMIVNKLTKYYEESGKMFRKIVGEPMEISSTAIREKVKRGEDISGLVPKGVDEYIRLYGLYREG